MDCDHVCFRFYRLVCYMVNKKWLADVPGSPAQVKKSLKKADETPPATSAKPGCSHWIDGELDSLSLYRSLNLFWKTRCERYGFDLLFVKEKEK